MDSVEIIDEPITERALRLRDTVDCFTEQAFKMYGGQSVNITIQFDSKLIGVVYDKFGEDTKMVRLDGDNCTATIKVQVSPTFWGWIFQFGKQMHIISPDEMIKEYKNKAAMLIE